VAQDRQDGVGDGADASAGQVQDGELPPVRQLVGHDLARLDAQLEQPGRHLVDEGGQLAVGVLLAFPGGVVGDRRDLVRLPRGDPQEVVEHGGITPPAVAAVQRGGLAGYAGRVIVGHGGCPLTVV
jgi:hypothetical protein